TSAAIFIFIAVVPMPSIARTMKAVFASTSLACSSWANGPVKRSRTGSRGRANAPRTLSQLNDPVAAFARTRGLHLEVPVSRTLASTATRNPIVQRHSRVADWFQIRADFDAIGSVLAVGKASYIARLRVEVAVSKRTAPASFGFFVILPHEIFDEAE